MFLFAVDSFMVMYADQVLKCLPDIRILISLHQQLSGGVVSGCNADELELSDQLRNTGMTNVHYFNVYSFLLPIFVLQSLKSHLLCYQFG